jgi:RHS repeat-associated protein
VNAVIEYDAANRPTRNSLTIPVGPLAGTYKTGTIYTADGQISAQGRLSWGGLPAEAIAYGYDDLGRLSSVQNAAQKYVSASTYNGVGMLQQYSAASGAHSMVRSLTYDDANRLTEDLTTTNLTGAHVAADHHYSYDSSGQVVKNQNVVLTAGDDTQCFNYDYAQQITQAWTPASGDCTVAASSSALGGPAPYWRSYSYDAVGDRTGLVRHASSAGGTDVTDSYSYPASGAGAVRPHAVRSVTESAGGQSVSHGYDASGSMVSRSGASGGQSWSYDVEGHLAAVTDGSQSQSDIYDADGNRLLQSDPSGTTLYLGDTELHAAAGTGVVSGTRTYMAFGMPVATRTATAGVAGSSVSWLVADAHGTAEVAISCRSGEVTRRYSDPFGGSRDVSAVAWANTHGFLDKPVDSFTATTHLGAREYDPTLGRFLSVDPVLSPMQPQQNNGYSYAWNNPINRADPSGLYGVGSDGEQLTPEQKGGAATATGTPPAAAGGSGVDSCNAACRDARRNVCQFTGGPACRSQGVGLMEQAQQKELELLGQLYSAMKDAADPCHGRSGCAVWNTLATITGVKGCLKEHNAIDCASLIPIGKLFKGGELAWDGIKWVHRATEAELPAISEANVGHTFRNATGHLADDTAANRTLLRGAAQPGNKVGSYNGIDTYTQLQSDGSQVWVEVRNGEITNGGVNQTPYTWDPTAGKLRR